MTRMMNLRRRIGGGLGGVLCVALAGCPSQAPSFQAELPDLLAAAQEQRGSLVEGRDVPSGPAEPLIDAADLDGCWAYRIDDSELDLGDQGTLPADGVDAVQFDVAGGRFSQQTLLRVAGGALTAAAVQEGDFELGADGEISGVIDTLLTTNQQGELEPDSVDETEFRQRAELTADGLLILTPINDEGQDEEPFVYQRIDCP